jgi:hypothetical protein
MTYNQIEYRQKIASLILTWAIIFVVAGCAYQVWTA